MSNLCPVCKQHKETREHYSYDCAATQQLIEQLKDVFEEFKEEREKWMRPQRDEWNLNEECEIGTTMVVLIAKARWVHHKERCKLVFHQRKTLNHTLCHEER